MRIRDFLTAFSLLLLAFLVYGLIVGGWVRPRGEITIASGPEGGAYAVFAREMAAQLRDQEEGRLQALSMVTSGSRENLALLSEGRAAFGIVQSAPPDNADTNLVAPLYREVLHILVRQADKAAHPGIQSFEGRRLALGEEGSGTHDVTSFVLNHFGVNVEKVPVAPGEGVAKLRAGEVDAVSFLAAMHAPLLDEALAGGDLALVPVARNDELIGMCSRSPHLVVTTIPPASYQGGPSGALPRAEIPTLGLESLLVCHKDVRPGTVRIVAEALFRGRARMANTIPGLAEIREPDNSRWLPYPVHRGADAYYRRGEPGFLERYAEVIALLFSLGLSAMAGIGALRKLSSRRKKNRIDAFYAQLGEVMEGVIGRNLEQEEIDEVESELWRIRKVAFKALTREKLKADESFRILQDQIHYCMEEVRRHY